MKKKVLSLLLVTAMAASLIVGCGGSSDVSTSAGTDTSNAGADTSGGGTESTGVVAEVQQEATSSDVDSANVDVVNIASERDPTDMGPWAGNMGGASAIVPLVYQSLQIMELNSEMEPCLAKTVTQVDALTYEVELFDYIIDSQGNPFTSSDVEFGLKTAKEIGKASQVKVVESIEVVDDYNFIVHFSENAAMGDFEAFFAQVNWVTQAAYEADGNGMAQAPVGTGPYAMTNYTGGSVITFEARDDYWQTDASYIARSSEAHADVINYQIITEAAQRAIAVESGSLDYGMVSLADKQRLEGEGIGIVGVPDNLTFMFFLNMSEGGESPVSTSLELRQALCYALDNAQISQLFTTADSVPVYDISNSNYPDYYGDVYESEDNLYQYDAAKAQELLKTSGFNGTLKLICSSDETSIKLAEILKQFWSAVGIDIEIESYQGNMMSDVSADPNNWDIYLLQYASTDYAVNVWEKVLNKAKYAWGGTINFIMDDELQDKLAEVRSIDGHTKENVIAFHDYVVDGAWAYGLIQGVNYYACSDKIDTKNVVFSEQRIIRPNATIYNVTE